MSQQPKKYHGPEVKCGGPGMCPDCTEKSKKYSKLNDPEFAEVWDRWREYQLEICENNQKLLEKLKDE